MRPQNRYGCIYGSHVLVCGIVILLRDHLRTCGGKNQHGLA